MGRKPTIKENNYDMLSRMREIRLNLGLNQEIFYFNYLNYPEIASRNTFGSAQDFMKKLESGYIDITPFMLQKYAEAGKCSIDYIVNGKDFNRDDLYNLDSMSYVNIVDLIHQLKEYGIINNFDTAEPHEETDSEEDSDGVLHTTVYGSPDEYVIKDEILRYLLNAYQMMDFMCEDGPIDKRTFKMWEIGFRMQYDYHLVDWSKIPKDKMPKLPDFIEDDAKWGDRVAILLDSLTHRM